jgi:predicted DsbA family dithiol-disulfide isomerase
MPNPVKIDFVSDVVCPWCAIGLQALLQAIGRVGPGLQVELRFRPFELNPGLAPEGESIAEHLGRKYGIGAEQLRQSGEAIRRRAAALGFVIDLGKRDRIYNTFDAHRLLHWAGTLGAAQQLALKQALLRAYHGEGKDVSDVRVLADAAGAAGLDPKRAAQVSGSGEYADAVRAEEDDYRQRGVNAVPSIVFDDQHLIQGGQPVETFERALRQLSGIAA